MKSNIKNIFAGVVGATMAVGMWSCSAEMPFEDEGTGTIHLHTTVSNLTTRSITGYTDEELNNKCMIYISRANGIEEGDNRDGLVYKKKGISNVDENIILKPGHYVAEAWTGDSVPASYDKKFFRGYTPFEVTKGSIKSVDLPCKIQNVIVSFNNESSALTYMNDDYTITIHNGSTDLVLDKNNMKGYFMIPDIKNEAEYLTYTVKGSRKEDNKEFTKTGTIENVQRAWEYILKFDYKAPTSDFGSVSFFDIIIEKEDASNEKEQPLISSAPTITGVGFSLNDSWNFTDPENIPDNLGVMICAIGEKLSAMKITIDNASESNYDLLNNLDISTVKAKGIVWEAPVYDEATKVCTAFVLFNKEFITKLQSGITHTIEITATDTSSKTSTATLTIQR